MKHKHFRKARDKLALNGLIICRRQNSRRSAWYVFGPSASNECDRSFSIMSIAITLLPAQPGPFPDPKTMLRTGRTSRGTSCENQPGEPAVRNNILAPARPGPSPNPNISFRSGEPAGKTSRDNQPESYYTASSPAGLASKLKCMLPTGRTSRGEPAGRTSQGNLPGEPAGRTSRENQPGELAGRTGRTR